MCWREFKVQLE